MRVAGAIMAGVCNSKKKLVISLVLTTTVVATRTGLETTVTFHVTCVVIPLGDVKWRLSHLEKQESRSATAMASSQGNTAIYQ